MTELQNPPPKQFKHVVMKPQDDERAEGEMLWKQYFKHPRLLSVFKRLLTEEELPEALRQQFAAEIIEYIKRRVLREPLSAGEKPLLAQSFEGTLIDVNDQFVTVEFDLDDRQELRRFPREQLAGPYLNREDIVQLRSELTLAPPIQSLSDQELKQLEKRRAARASAQGKIKRARAPEDLP